MKVETNNSLQQNDIFSVFVNESRRIETNVYDKVLRKTRNALFYAGGLSLFQGLLCMFNSRPDFIMVWLIIAFTEAGAFISLIFWTKTKPYYALLCGLIFLIGLIAVITVSHTMQEGSSATQKIHFSSMIVKVVIIAILALQLRDARSLQQIKNR